MCALNFLAFNMFHESIENSFSLKAYAIPSAITIKALSSF